MSAGGYYSLPVSQRVGGEQRGWEKQSDFNRATLILVSTPWTTNKSQRQRLNETIRKRNRNIETIEVIASAWPCACAHYSSPERGRLAVTDARNGGRGKKSEEIWYPPRTPKIIGSEVSTRVPRIIMLSRPQCVTLFRRSTAITLYLRYNLASMREGCGYTDVKG